MSKCRSRKNAPQATPTAVLDAFFPQIVYVADLKLPPFTLYHQLALEEAKNPLVTNKPPETIDVVSALLILSLPPEKIASLFERGQDYFKAQVRTFSMRVPACEIIGLVGRLVTHMNTGFASWIAQADPEGGEDNPLLRPSTPPVVPVALAGSPASSPASMPADGPSSAS